MKLKSVLSIFITATVIVTLLVFGCGDELQEDKGELGPEVTAEQVMVAINTATGGRTILDSGQDEAVHTETNQKVEMGGAQVIQDEILKVFHRAENDENIKYVIHLRTITYPDGEADIVDTELKPIYIEKNNTTPTDSPFTNAEIKTNMYSPHDVQKILTSRSDEVLRAKGTESDQPDKLTLHNLRVRKISINAPANVSKAENCLNIPNCQIPATEIKFDIAQWTKDDWKKINFEMVLSAVSPYFAQELQSCQGAYVNIPSLGRDVYVRECRVVRDFRYPVPN